MQRYERFECDLSQDGYAEWPESYLDRGFCPISVGQVVGGDEPHSYEIVAKLGHGGFSTVWLAIGTPQANNSGLWVAIKIMQAREQRANISREIAALNNLVDADVIDYFGSFDINMPDNNTHVCLVMPLSGPCVKEYIELHPSPSLDQKMLLSRECISVLSKIHRAGYVHGDFTSNNILFRPYSTEDMSKEEMHDWIGHSRSCEIYDKKPSEPWPQNLPKKLWAPVSLWNLVDVNRMELEVIDLGSSHPKNRPGESATMVSFAAPEILEGGNSSTCESDIWSLGVLICEIINRWSPFEGGGSGPFVVTLHKAYLYQEDGKPTDRSSRLAFFREEFRNNKDLTTHQKERLAHLFLRIFQENPSDRLDLHSIKDELDDIGHLPGPSA